MTDTAAPMRPRIPVFRTAYEGYQLGIAAIFSSGRMFRFFVYGSVLIVALFALLISGNFMMSVLVASNRTFAILASLLFGILGYALIAAGQTPLGVAIQRHILLSELPGRSYAAYLTIREGRRFFLVSIATLAFFYVASFMHVPVLYVIYGVNLFDETAYLDLVTNNSSSIAVMMLVWFVAFIVAALLSTKSSFAFPITAVNRAISALKGSFAETRGSMWRLFFVFALIFVPPALVYMIASFAATMTLATRISSRGQMTDGSFDSEALYGMLLAPEVIIATIVIVLAVMLSYVAMAAAAARAYQIRVDRGLSGVAEVFS